MVNGAPHQPHHQHLHPAALQQPHLVIQAELHKAWGKREAMRHTHPPPPLPVSVETEEQVFKSCENTNKETIDILKMWLNTDLRKKILNLRCAIRNFQSGTPSRDTYTSLRIYKGLLPGLTQLPRQMLVKNRKQEPIFVSYSVITAFYC